jgi:hypothetical protein
LNGHQEGKRDNQSKKWIIKMAIRQRRERWCEFHCFALLPSIPSMPDGLPGNIPDFYLTKANDVRTSKVGVLRDSHNRFFNTV